MNTRISNLLNTLRSDLNSVQNSFKFHFYDDEWKSPANLTQLDHIQTNKIEKFVEKQMKAYKIIGQFPIVLCDVKFEEDLYTTFAPDYGIISTYYWTSFTGFDMRNHLIMTVIGMILNTYPFDLRTHDPDIGCPADYGAFGNLKPSLDSGSFCDECDRRINRAVRDGKLPLKDKASILKLLDLIAKRKQCFVLMPFHKSFDEIYQSTIKRTLTDNEWDCTRADEILQAREVMTIVEENIHRADLIIADLTNRNPNVFYEVGYAHAVGKNTVLITQSINDVPFDLRHHQCIEYTHSADGLRQLSKSIENIAC